MDLIAWGGPNPEEQVASQLDRSRLYQLLALLPDRCRTIIEMRKLQGISQREIAVRLGVSESIVENDCVRGLKVIRQHLLNGGESQDDPTGKQVRRGSQAVG